MKLEYLKEDLRFIKALWSPFKPFGLKFYFGKTKIGTPYFLPRRKFGFDFVRLGWKTKWREDDYRFEWAPLLSFIFFGYQIAIIVDAPEQHHYWEAWLYYEYNTDDRLPKWQRIRQCRERFPIKWEIYEAGGIKKIIDYYDLILRKKYLR